MRKRINSSALMNASIVCGLTSVIVMLAREPQDGHGRLIDVPGGRNPRKISVWHEEHRYGSRESGVSGLDEVSIGISIFANEIPESSVSENDCGSTRGLRAPLLDPLPCVSLIDQTPVRRGKRREETGNHEAAPTEELVSRDDTPEQRVSLGRLRGNDHEAHRFLRPSADVDVAVGRADDQVVVRREQLVDPRGTQEADADFHPVDAGHHSSPTACGTSRHT